MMPLSSLFFLSLPYFKATFVAMSCEAAWPSLVPSSLSYQQLHGFIRFFSPVLA